MHIEEKSQETFPRGIVAEGWNGVVRGICAYGYHFTRSELQKHNVSFWKSLKQLILNAFGVETQQQCNDRDDHTRRRERYNQRLELTHWCVGYILEKAQSELGHRDWFKLVLDYTGGGTTFYKCDVEIERVVSTKPEVFIVTISRPRGEADIEREIATIYGLELKK